jgi:hypothetical protein
MEIAIFKGVTTEGVITSIEENSKKYNEGLVADMSNLPERTMVKKGAAEIGDIIKELKTSRIAITKANTAAVNKEHDAIVSRLVIANKPYTDLLDAYNVVRKKELAAEDARKQAVLDAAKFENDHEIGLLMNKTFAYDRQQAIDAQAARDKQIADEAASRAIDQQNRLAEAKERDRVNEENARLANVEHVRGINRSIFSLFLSVGLDHYSAQTVTQALIDKKVPNTIIHY